MADSAVTFHLAPIPVWEAQAGQPAYLPEGFAAEGFIHCTDGEVQVLATANRFYVGDPRPFVLLTIAVERVTAPIRYEDPDRIFPHIYGPLNTEAVVAVRGMRRDDDGRFLAIEPA